MIQQEYLPIFANFFSRSKIQELIYKKNPRYISTTLYHSKYCLNNRSNLQYKDLFDTIYQELLSNYRCEYVYKNELLHNEILSNRHPEGAKLLTEINVCNSKVDLLVINGTITAYEIKTELDTIQRLEAQLLDYIKVFDRVCLVISKNKIKKIEEIINSNELFHHIGICTLSNNLILEHRKSKSSLGLSYKVLDKYAMLNTINQSEIKLHYPELNNIDYVDNISVKEMHTILKDVLSKRTNDLSFFIDQLPDSLKMIGYSLHNLAKKDKIKLLQKLDNYVADSIL